MISRSKHWFHIPVMGTGFTLDTAIKVAPYGIASVISLVDDVIIEKIRKHYCTLHQLPYEYISVKDPEHREKRIQLYLDLVYKLVSEKVDQIKSLPFELGNDKDKYFQLLPSSAEIKSEYFDYLSICQTNPNLEIEKYLNANIIPGSIDANIMTKLDRRRLNSKGEEEEGCLSDAKSALKGFAKSINPGRIVYSAGMNTSLFAYMEEFSCFQWQGDTPPEKKVVIKISDFRSAQIQSKFFAKKGIIVDEWRLESSINCGGHAFVSDGRLMGLNLQDFKDQKQKIMDLVHKELDKYFERNSIKPNQKMYESKVRFTVQGGLGNNGENLRLTQSYNVDGVGWASPFLLVKEATSVDDATRTKLKEAREKDIYLSKSSPLGILYYNLRNSASEQWHQEMIDKDKPGSACPKGFLAINNDSQGKPICSASTKYIVNKLDGNDGQVPDVDFVLGKQCICHHLGFGILKSLGINKSNVPVAVCPGPNLAYYHSEFTLKDMVECIYYPYDLARSNRPHVFAKELSLYLDYMEDLAEHIDENAKELIKLIPNIEEGMDYYKNLIKEEQAYPLENFFSIEQQIFRGREVIDKLKSNLEFYNTAKKKTAV